MPFGPSNGFWRLWTRWSKDSDAFCHSLSDPGRKLSGEHRNSLSPCATQIVVEPPWQKPCCVSCLPVQNKLTYLIVPWARLWLAKQSPANRRVIVGKQQAQTSRRGENRASVLSVLKKCRFRHSETADSFPKMVCGFQTMICNLQGICAWKLARFFSTHIAIRFFKAWPVTSIRPLVVEFIQRHCHTRMLRINFGLTWPLDAHVTQVNMNVNIPTPPTQRPNVRCACGAS